MKKSIMWLLLPLILFAAPRLRAHGGGEIQLANVPVGPYKMTAWLNPPQPRVGETIHITVGLAEPPRDTPMLDGEVMVQVTAVSDQQLLLSTPATTAESVNKLFYETDFVLEEVGAFEVLLRVSGPDGGGEASFEMSVTDNGRVNWLLIGLVALATIAGVTIYRRLNVYKPSDKLVTFR